MGMTLQSLTQAIQQHIDTEMDAEVAAGMAEHALGFFGFYNRIIDNAPTKPSDKASDDFTIEIMNAVVVAIRIKFLLNTFLLFIV